MKDAIARDTVSKLQRRVQQLESSQSAIISHFSLVLEEAHIDQSGAQWHAASLRTKCEVCGK